MTVTYSEKAKLGVFQIVLIYLCFSTLWIYFSDSILSVLTQDPATIKRISIAKGMLFLIITAILLYTLLLRYAQELINSYDEIQISHNRLNHALIAANQGFFELNLATGEAFVSKCYLTMLGYDTDKPVPTLEWWQESLHPDDRDHAIKVLNECLSGSKSEYRICYRLRTKSGEWKWIESSGQIIQYGTDNKPQIMIGMHSDIDERKKVLKA
ncbi:putative diguanylate cyclase [Geobacter sp. OR-1]|uniref:PAS domain-containing protein n=1 Tax=Geobacter sp. OR-1 TaxID=1266765 RepID=UPI00054336BD|nr:PAS domain-containing protein [Geobacter sp. OR-1]GAM11091.1 putative diguanylate cyclase [Geobacter sp. OR-1]